MEVKESLFLRKKTKTSEYLYHYRYSDGRVKISDVVDVLGDASNATLMFQFSKPTLHATKSEWYVDFYVYLPPDYNKPIRVKRTNGFGQFSLYADKMAHGESLRLQLEKDLEQGWNPLESKRKTQQLSPLAYVHGNKQTHASSIISLIEEYLLLKKDELSFRNKSYSTYQSKFRFMEQWLRKHGKSDLLITNFTVDDSRHFIAGLKDGSVTGKKLSNTSIHNYISVIQIFWYWATDKYENLHILQPWKKIKKPSVSEGRLYVFTKQQRDKIFSYLIETNQILMWCAARLVYQSWIRPGNELTGIQVKDFDLVDNKIWIPAECAKNGKLDFIPLPLDVKSKLHLERYPADYFVFGQNATTLKRCHREYWSKKFTKILRDELNIPAPLSLYIFKHTGNKVASENKMSPMEQQRINRHHSLDQTMEYNRKLEKIKSEDLVKYFVD